MDLFVDLFPWRQLFVFSIYRATRHSIHTLYLRKSQSIAGIREQFNSKWEMEIYVLPRMKKHINVGQSKILPNLEPKRNNSEKLAMPNLEQI